MRDITYTPAMQTFDLILFILAIVLLVIVPLLVKIVQKIAKMDEKVYLVYVKRANNTIDVIGIFDSEKHTEKVKDKYALMKDVAAVCSAKICIPKKLYNAENFLYFKLIYDEKTGIPIPRVQILTKNEIDGKNENELDSYIFSLKNVSHS